VFVRLAKPKSLPSQGRPADSLAMRSASRARSALICSLTVSSLSGLQSLHGSDAVPAAAKLIHAKVARPNNSVSALAIVLCVAAFCRLRQSKMGAGQLCRSPATDPCKSGSQREPPTKAPVGPHAGHRNRWARRWLSIVIMAPGFANRRANIWGIRGTLSEAGFLRVSSDAFVSKSVGNHFVRPIDVAKVNDDRAGHLPLQAN
jgi:hypothetical protein